MAIWNFYNTWKYMVRWRHDYCFSVAKLTTFHCWTCYLPIIITQIRLKIRLRLDWLLHDISKLNSLLSWISVSFCLPLQHSTHNLYTKYVFYGKCMIFTRFLLSQKSTFTRDQLLEFYSLDKYIYYIENRPWPIFWFVMRK